MMPLPDNNWLVSAVEGKLTAKVLDLEKRLSQLTFTPTVNRFDPIAAMKKGRGK